MDEKPPKSMHSSSCTVEQEEEERSEKSEKSEQESAGEESNSPSVAFEATPERGIEELEEEPREVSPVKEIETVFTKLPQKARPPSEEEPEFAINMFNKSVSLTEKSGMLSQSTIPQATPTQYVIDMSAQ